MVSSAGTSEREVKWDVDPDFVLPDFRDLVGQTTQLGEQELQAAYFDTSDLRLWSRRITLRHRQGEGPPPGTWILELPVSTSGDVPERSELTWPGPRDAVPGEARRIIRGIVRHEWLAPIVEIESRRRRIALLGDDGSPLGELDDDWVTVHGGSRDGLRFRQIEFELEDAGAGLLEGVTGRLRSAGADPSAPGPNLQRALDDELGRDSLPPLDGRSTVGDLIRQSLGGGLQRIGHHDYRLRLRHRDPAAVDIHKCQVAVRRLRSELRTLGPALDPVWLRHLRTDLQWVGSALGAVRDLDVLDNYLHRSRAEGLGDPEGIALLASEVRRSRLPTVEALDKVLQSDRYLTLLDKLHAASSAPPFLRDPPAVPSADDPAKERIPAMVSRPWQQLRKEAERARRSPSDHRLHRVRVRAKQVRYAAALAEPVIGRAARRSAAGAKELQRILGDHRDAVVGERWLRDQLGIGLPMADFAAGQLSADLAVRRHRARRHWRKAWKQTNRSPVGLWVP